MNVYKVRRKADGFFLTSDGGWSKSKGKVYTHARYAATSLNKKQISCKGSVNNYEVVEYNTSEVQSIDIYAITMRGSVPKGMLLIWDTKE